MTAVQWLLKHESGGVLRVNFADHVRAVVDVACAAMALFVVLQLVPVIVVAVCASGLVGCGVVLALDGAVGRYKVHKALRL